MIALRFIRKLAVESVILQNVVARANGDLENMINWKGTDQDMLAIIKYIADEDKPDVWAEWGELSDKSKK